MLALPCSLLVTPLEVEVLRDGEASFSFNATRSGDYTIQARPPFCCRANIHKTVKAILLSWLSGNPPPKHACLIREATGTLPTPTETGERVSAAFPFNATRSGDFTIQARARNLLSLASLSLDPAHSPYPSTPLARGTTQSRRDTPDARVSDS